MAADLCIHVFTKKFTPEDYKQFKKDTLGSKYFGTPSTKKWNNLFTLCSKTPNVWVGEVSWLKAALFDARETFVPSMVEAVHEIIGEDFPVIDDALIKKIKAALGLKNNTKYETSTEDKILAFLKRHKGKQAFVVSW